MSAANDEHLRAIQPRVTALEELLTHFERVVAELNAVVLQQQTQMERLEARILRLSQGLDTLRQTIPTPPLDLEAERPPHY